MGIIQYILFAVGVLASVYIEINNKLPGIKLACICNHKSNILQIEKIGNKIVKVIKI